MRKFNRFSFVLMAVATLVFSACSSDDDPAPDEEKKDLTQVTVEESKKDVEDSGIALVQKMGELEDSESIDVLMHLMELMGGEDASQSQAMAFNVPLKAAALISSDKGDVSGVFELLKSVSEEPEKATSLSEEFSKVTARYVYNFETQDVDSFAHEGAIVIEFPGTEASTTNDASIVIGDLATQAVTGGFESDLAEVPTALKAKLTFQEVVILDYSFSASYQADGVPTSVSTSLALGDFSFNVDMANKQSTSASFDYSLKSGDDVLIGMGVSAAGNWTQSNVEANVEEIEEEKSYPYSYYNPSTGQYEQAWATYTDTYTEVHFENIINNANAYVILMDVKAIGSIDINEMVDGMASIDEQELADEARANAEVALINEQASFALVYTADETAVIAAMKAYASTYTDDYDGETYYEPDMKLIFKDDSEVSAETYVENSLSDFFDEINKFITKLNGEYEMDMETVDLDS